MRITIVADSATPAEVYALTLAFQRAQQDNEPLVLTSKPTVSVVGSALGWSTPPMSMVRAMSTLAHMGSGALTVPVEPPVNLADPARRNMAVYSDEAEADDIHAWFINEDGTPYMYERAEQQTAFPNDPPDAYQTIGEAEAAANGITPIPTMDEDYPVGTVGHTLGLKVSHGTSSDPHAARSGEFCDKCGVLLEK